MATKRPPVTPEPTETNLLSLPQEIAIDPQSMLAGYQRWQKLSRSGERATSPTLAHSQFRGALLRLRSRVHSSEAIHRAATTLPIKAPEADDVVVRLGPLRLDFWHRQSLLNGAIRDVINTWPARAQSPAAQCWLVDEIRPLLDAAPMPGPSHRSNMVTRVMLRSFKAAVTLSVAALRRSQLERIHVGNHVVYRAMQALVSVEKVPDAELEALVEDLLEFHVAPAPKGVGVPGYGDQLKFLQHATLVLASLLLPGEAALESIYSKWRTQNEAQRAVDDSPLPPGGVSIVLLGPNAQSEVGITAATLECQPGDRECFVQAETRGAIRPGRPAVLALPEIRTRLTGSWVALVTEPVSFGAYAVDEVLRAAAKNPNAAIIYSDHDEQLASGSVGRPFFKPGWSPEFFFEFNYLGGVVFVARHIFDRWAEGKERMTSADVSRLVLDCHRRKEAIVRIPRTLWRRLESVPVEDPNHAQAVAEHFRAEGTEVDIQSTPVGRKVTFKLKETPKVSLIVPFKDRPELLEQLVTTLFEHERYQNLELVLVSNNSKNAATRRLLNQLTDPRIRTFEWNHPFNYQSLNNAAVRQWSTGKYVVFLNNDVSWLPGGAIEEMLGQCQRPEIGAVGANLLYPNGRLQHAGVALGVCGFAAHPFSQVRPNARWTAYGLPSWTRNYLAVTAACVMMRRSVFDEVGGFDEEFVVSGGDVDLCLRIGAKGYRIVNTPHVGLVHHESATRAGTLIPDSDAWKSYASFHRYVRDGDPYYNPNLTLTSMDCLPRVDDRPAEELALQLLTTMLPSSKHLSES